ncbi:hypothetical protein BJ085DRAFT_30366 [Dimargaris cristalligena]|uniref:Uncharacterized protein n=1 Tax=Dimargaris cristalligena TaxID=215637 RepID=A0A4Q0A267_9FUNG|nr:hypothetical protein BJ085DRAFT_30366 [Dimargaris cristalligena]|eukprot:RKP40195.1 hypothetical protein BJ085DRAFT_30366 [Dimargaris cristalligena]
MAFGCGNGTGTGIGNKGDSFNYPTLFGPTLVTWGRCSDDNITLHHLGFDGHHWVATTPAKLMRYTLVNWSEDREIDELYSNLSSTRPFISLYQNQLPLSFTPLPLLHSTFPERKELWTTDNLRKAGLTNTNNSPEKQASDAVWVRKDPV